MSPRSDESRPGYEIITPHDPSRGPVTAVRNVVIQSSLAQLRAHGFYERYATLIDRAALELLRSDLGPGWIPIELAMKHYQACEDLRLSIPEIMTVAARVGDRLQETSLVSPAKKLRDASVDLWAEVKALQRFRERLHQGGSGQIVKVGPKEMLVEYRGLVLTQFHYYRNAQVAVLRAAYGSVGARITQLKIVHYSAPRDEVTYRVCWQ